MTPDAWLPLIERFGLPLLVLVIAALALYRRWIVTGSDHERKVALLTTEVEYRERLRIEERASRISAEARLAKLTATLPAIADAIAVRERDLEKLMELARDDRATIDGLRGELTGLRETFVRQLAELRDAFELLARDLRG